MQAEGGKTSFPDRADILKSGPQFYHPNKPIDTQGGQSVGL